LELYDIIRPRCFDVIDFKNGGPKGQALLAVPH
jgi:hypothetical protein